MENIVYYDSISDVPKAKRQVLLIDHNIDIARQREARKLDLSGRLVTPEPLAIYNDLLYQSLYIPANVAAQNFAFPPGHPIAREHYVEHPHKDSYYLPARKYYELTLTEKASELTDLLASLGAIHVRVRVKHHEDTKNAYGLNVSKVLNGFFAGENYSRSSSVQEEVIFDERYNPNKFPSIPSHLKWYKNEPAWIGLARRRLEHRTTSFNVLLSHESSLDIHASVFASTGMFDANAKAQIRKSRSVVWEFSGAFADFDSLCKVR